MSELVTLEWRPYFRGSKHEQAIVALENGIRILVLREKEDQRYYVGALLRTNTAYSWFDTVNRTNDITGPLECLAIVEHYVELYRHHDKRE